MSLKGRYFKNYCMFMDVFIWERNTLVLSFEHSFVSFVVIEFLNTKDTKVITKDTKYL